MHAIASLAEYQGLYGGFLFPEKLLQKIWWRGDFERAALATAAGCPVRVLDPGRWNHLAGPDFLGARIAFGANSPVTGDIEVHLDTRDWDAHGHARDPAYAGVLLHVVLFPPAAGLVTRGWAGAEIPVAALLPLLHRGLEEFAADDAVESLAGDAWLGLVEALAALPVADLRRELEAQAARRWAQKVRFAGLRLRRLGWDAACHHSALEVLGYGANRAPMLRLAAAFPRVDWVQGRIDPAVAWTAEEGAWRVQGVRPANQPARRLFTYAAWQRRAPAWPGWFRSWAEGRPPAEAAGETGVERRRLALRRVREELAAGLGLPGRAGGRFDNLVTDALLPLAAAEGGAGLHPWWFHWFLGDAPAGVRLALRRLGVADGRTQPQCHGLAQGLLGWLLEREAAKCSLASPAGAPKRGVLP
ncbi:MAG: DUF2851 family protein [Opitutaceae bacterium]